MDSHIHISMKYFASKCDKNIKRVLLSSTLPVVTAATVELKSYLDKRTIQILHILTLTHSNKIFL